MLNVNIIISLVPAHLLHHFSYKLFESDANDFTLNALFCAGPYKHSMNVSIQVDNQPLKNHYLMFHQNYSSIQVDLDQAL